MIKLAVIVPAAGSGTRMGSRLPKPFLKLQDLTILEHTIRCFAKMEAVTQIVISTSEEWMDEVNAILNKYKEDVEKLSVVTGGDERQYSIYNAFSVIDEGIPLIAVHDAVRPFISEELVINCSKSAQEFGGAIIAVPAKDTIKKIDLDFSIVVTPDRSSLWQAQTPQIFKRELLISAYKSALESGFLGTDDASLVERIGGTVKVIEGDRRNLKITYPIDLKIAELILEEQK